MNELEIQLENQILDRNNTIEMAQNNFFETTFGKVLNTALDIGLKAVLPDLIEDEIINIKDSILENGFSEGIKEVINTAINTGKSAIGIVTGDFENISQIEMAVKKGGLLDKTSELIDFALNIANQKNLISKDITSVIKTGKNTIINTMEDKIEKTLTTQIKAIENIEKYCDIWKDAFNNQDITKMENAIKNIDKNLGKIVPLESVLNNAKTIENLHNIIKNTGSFEISEETMQLAQRFN